MMVAQLVEALVALLILTGAFFTLAGSIAMVRFPDFFLRLHGPTKATTLGVGALLLAVALYLSWHEGQVRIQEVLIMLFLFMTAPVSAHLLAKAALHLGVHCQLELPRKRLGAPGWRGVPVPGSRAGAAPQRWEEPSAERDAGSA
jgi:multicomponent K+:H+ antiporter subunit G